MLVKFVALCSEHYELCTFSCNLNVNMIQILTRTLTDEYFWCRPAREQTFNRLVDSWLSSSVVKMSEDEAHSQSAVCWWRWQWGWGGCESVVWNESSRRAGTDAKELCERLSLDDYWCSGKLKTVLWTLAGRKVSDSCFPKDKLLFHPIRKQGRCYMKQLNDLFPKNQQFQNQTSLSGVQDICSCQHPTYWQKPAANRLLLAVRRSENCDSTSCSGDWLLTWAHTNRCPHGKFLQLAALYDSRINLWQQDKLREHWYLSWSAAETWMMSRWHKDQIWLNAANQIKYFITCKNTKLFKWGTICSNQPDFLYFFHKVVFISYWPVWNSVENVFSYLW